MEPSSPSPETVTSEEGAPAPRVDTVDLSSEQAQHFFDRSIVYQHIQALRGQLAQLKLNWLLATRGLLDDGGRDLHPNKFRIAAGRTRRAIDLLMEHAALLEASPEALLPEPSGIDVVKVMPDLGGEP
jgi:hypothetical protein